MDTMPYRSVAEILVAQAERLGDKVALMYKKEGRYHSITYREFLDYALTGARGLRKEGIRPGERVAILAENSHHWALTDMAIFLAGGVVVPIYTTETPEQEAYILNDAQVRAVFISSRQHYEKLLAVRDQLPLLEYVFSFERFHFQRELPVMTIYQLAEIPSPATTAERTEILEGLREVDPEDPATIIYTSGTTGRPKGVVLTHRNILMDAWLGIKKINDIREDDLFLSFLPLSHAFERTCGYYCAIMTGSTIAYAESIEKVPENLKEVRPTLMVSVPRLFEKVYHRVYEDVHRMSLAKRTLFHRAVALGKRYVECRYIERRRSVCLLMAARIANYFIFKKIRKGLGGRLRFAISGGAPLERVVNEFFWAVGVPILEGYGLTETSPAICINTFDHIRFGTVGTAFEQTDVRTAEDGELMIRGPMVMKGYFNRPDKTREVIRDGWLYTGDIATIDSDGFIAITDRKKEIIITAGGKNIPPQYVEGAIRRDKFVNQAVVYGDRKPYLVALIVPNVERLVEWARKRKISFFDVDDLTHNTEVTDLFRERVDGINANLAHYETIKKFILVPKAFTVEAGELTPTLKVRRRVVYGKFHEELEQLYEHPRSEESGTDTPGPQPTAESTPRGDE